MTVRLGRLTLRRFFTSGAPAAATLDLGRRPLHPLPEGPVPKLHRQLQQAQEKGRTQQRQALSPTPRQELSPSGVHAGAGADGAPNGQQLQWPSRPPVRSR